MCLFCFVFARMTRLFVFFLLACVADVSAFTFSDTIVLHTFFSKLQQAQKNRQTILVYLSSASRVGLEMPGVRNSNLIMAMKFYISLTRLVSRNHFMRKYKSGKYAFWLNIVKVQEHARVAAVSYSFCFLMS